MTLTRFYLILGTLTCLLLFYANMIGWDVMNFNNLGRVGPRGPSVYHK